MTCAAASCTVTPSAGRPFCAAHWAALPGRERSRVSMSLRSRHSCVTREVIARAAALLDREGELA